MAATLCSLEIMLFRNSKGDEDPGLLRKLQITVPIAIAIMRVKISHYHR